MDEYTPPENRPRALHILAVLALFCSLGAMVGGLLAYGLAVAQGIDFEAVMSSLTVDSPAAERGFVRWSLGLNHFFMFLLPALATVWVFYKKDAAAELGLWPLPGLRATGLGILFLAVAMPAVQFSYFLNQKIPLPEWARLMEDSTAETVKALLVMGSPWAFLGNLVVVALLPAVGEELVFRGILQGQLARRVASPHVAIWLTAAIFSAIHMQFEGFLPRLLLGAALGYLYFFTKNLWVPIAAHFFNNGAQVAAAYFFSEKMKGIDLEKDIEVPVWAAIGSVVLTVFIGQKIWEGGRRGWPFLEAL